MSAHFEEEQDEDWNDGIPCGHVLKECHDYCVDVSEYNPDDGQGSDSTSAERVLPLNEFHRHFRFHNAETQALALEAALQYKSKINLKYGLYNNRWRFKDGSHEQVVEVEVRSQQNSKLPVLVCLLSASDRERALSNHSEWMYFTNVHGDTDIRHRSADPMRVLLLGQFVMFDMNGCGTTVYHTNGDPMDCRRENLSIRDKQQPATTDKRKHRTPVCEEQEEEEQGDRTRRRPRTNGPGVTHMQKQSKFRVRVRGQIIANLHYTKDDYEEVRAQANLCAQELPYVNKHKPS